MGGRGELSWLRHSFTGAQRSVVGNLAGRPTGGEELRSTYPAVSLKSALFLRLVSRSRVRFAPFLPQVVGWDGRVQRCVKVHVPDQYCLQKVLDTMLPSRTRRARLL